MQTTAQTIKDDRSAKIVGDLRSRKGKRGRYMEKEILNPGARETFL